MKRDTRKLESFEHFEKSLTEDIAGGGFGPAVKIGLKNFADQRRALHAPLCDRFRQVRHGEMFHSLRRAPPRGKPRITALYAPAVRALRCSPAGFGVLRGLHGRRNRQAGGEGAPSRFAWPLRGSSKRTHSTFTLNRDPLALLARLAS